MKLTEKGCWWSGHPLLSPLALTVSRFPDASGRCSEGLRAWQGQAARPLLYPQVQGAFSQGTGTPPAPPLVLGAKDSQSALAGTIVLR